MVRQLLLAFVAAIFFLAYGALALVFAPVLALPVWTRRGMRRFIRFFYRAFVACARWTGLFRVELDEATRASLASLNGAVVVNPFLSIVARRMFIVNTGDAEATVSAAVRSLGDGVNVVIFPQGTRGGATLHRGAARIALSSRAPVQPVRIDYDPPVLTKGQPWWDVGDRTIRITLCALPPIIPDAPPSHSAARLLTKMLFDGLMV